MCRDALWLIKIEHKLEKLWVCFILYRRSNSLLPASGYRKHKGDLKSLWQVSVLSIHLLIYFSASFTIHGLDLAENDGSFLNRSNSRMLKLTHRRSIFPIGQTEVYHGEKCSSKKLDLFFPLLQIHLNPPIFGSCCQNRTPHPHIWFGLPKQRSLKHLLYPFLNHFLFWVRYRCFSGIYFWLGIYWCLQI